MAKKKTKTSKPAKLGKADQARAMRESNYAKAAAAKDGIPANAPAEAHRPAKGKKQPSLPGMLPPDDAQLDSLCSAFIEQSEAWAAAQKEANALKEKIAEYMGAKGLPKYRYRDGEETRDFTFAKAKLRVSKVKAKEVEVGE